MLKINSFNFGYRFSFYVRVVAVRCGTLLQPMLVSGERSFCIKFNWRRSLVVVSCYRNCIIILLNCHCVCSYRLEVKKQQKQLWDVYVRQTTTTFSGLGKESGGCWRGGRILQVWIKNQLIYYPTNISLPINLQTPQTYTFQFFKPHKHSPTNSQIYTLNHINQC